MRVLHVEGGCQSALAWPDRRVSLRELCDAGVGSAEDDGGAVLGQVDAAAHACRSKRREFTFFLSSLTTSTHRH